MRSCINVFLLLLGILFALTSASAKTSPESTVRSLYHQVIMRKPLGIPKDADRKVIWPFLSKRLISELNAAQGCESDYFRQHAGQNGKPAIDWIETGLFSGANEKGLPAEANVERSAQQNDGSTLVYVRLTYKETSETYGRTADPANTFHWNIAAVVVSQDGEFRVDDILFLNDDGMKIESRMSDFFRGCNGSRWVGDKQ